MEGAGHWGVCVMSYYLLSQATSILGSSAAPTLALAKDQPNRVC